MRVKMKDKLSRALSLLLAINLILVGVVATDTYYSIDSDNAYAAEGVISGALGTNEYSNEASGTANLELGQTYSMAGYNWICAEKNGNLAVLQSTGVTGGAWPGYSMSGTLTNAAGDTITLTSANAYYTRNIDGYDIRLYDAKTQALYNKIKAFEYEGASYGKGLYLVSNAKVGATTHGQQGSGHYWTALKTASDNHSSFGITRNEVWLGTYYSENGVYYAWYARTDMLSTSVQGNLNVVAPAFNLDQSKIDVVNGNNIVGFIESSGISAIPSKESLEFDEGEEVDLTSLFSSVKYVGGSNNGKNAEYTISIDGDRAGIIENNVWTTPIGINSDSTITLTIEDTIKHFTTTQNVVVKKIEQGWTDRDELEPSDEQGFHTWKDTNTNITWKYKYNDEGNIAYLYTEDSVTGIINEGKSSQLIVPSSINGVKVVGIGGGQKDGEIIPFISAADDKQHNYWESIYIPSSVETINDGAFIGNKANADIVIPGTVKKIGARAFMGSKLKSVIFNDAQGTSVNTEAFANISTLEKVAFRGEEISVGKKAFANNDALTHVSIGSGKATIGYKAFADNKSLSNISIGSNNVTIGEKAFSNLPSLKTIKIPEGTNIVDNSYAFEKSTNLENIRINTETVGSNIFSENKKLSKVIFGENVKRVKYDWAGTAISNVEIVSEAVDRTTYSLNADTIFEMKKEGGSPFGYANNLSVIGIFKNTTGDSEAYNAETDPVTAKVAYLKKLYATNETIKGYAKGEAADISIDTINTSEIPSDVIENDDAVQTGIEAYYNGTVLTGETLDKSKMTVYKIFDTEQKGVYSSEEFYIIRSSEVENILLNRINEETNITKPFEENEVKTITAEDEAAGMIGVTVVVLQKDSSGNILVDYETKKVKAFTYPVTILVKPYTAEDDFFENYGSYSTVINTINELKDTNRTLEVEISNLNQQITEKNSSISALEEQIETKDGEIESLNAQIAALKQEKQDLETDKESLQQNLADANQKLTDAINSYAKLLDSTKLDKSDYTYSVTEDGVTKDYVLVNGEEAEYDKSSATEMVLPSGKTVTVYTGTDKDGNEFKFYVDDDGVHVVTIESGNITSDTVSSDTIVALQHKIAAQLQLMKDQLSKMKSALDEIAGSLNIDDLENKTDDEKVEAIINAINALNNKVSDLEKSVASKDKLIETLREQNGQQAATIEQANKTIENLNNQITAVQGKLSETQEALDIANRNLDTANGNLSDAQQQISTISGNLEKTENDLETAQEALAEKQTDLDQANALIDSTNAALTKAQEDLSTARNDLSAVQKTLSDTQAELEAAKTALNTANASLAKAQQEITSLTTEIENLRDTIAGYQSMLDSIKNALGLTSEADNTEILAEISDLNTRLSTLDERIVSLASLLGIDTNGKTDSAIMDEIISKVTALTKDYDTVTKNYNKIVKKIYGADETVDVSNKSVDEVLAAIDSLSGDTSAIAKQLQEAITGKTVSDGDLMQLAALLDQVKTMKSDLDQKSDLLNQIMEALGITDSAQILQTILNLKTQVAALEKENAELKAGGATNDSSASYNSGYNAGYNAGYVAGAQASNNNNTASVQIASLTSQLTSFTKENAQLKEENQSLSDGIDNLYEQVSDAGVSASILSLNETSSSRVSKLQKIGNAISNLIDNNKNSTTENKALQSQNKKLTDENKILQGSNEKLSSKNKSLTSKNNKLSASEKKLKTQVSSLQSQVESLKKSNSSSSTTASRYNVATGVANNGYASNTASVKPSSSTNTTESATGTEKTEDKSKSSNTETDKKKNKKSISDEVSIESTAITQSTALDVGSGTERQLGEVFETMLPTSTTKAGTQNASTTLNINEGEVVDITTNAKETCLATEEQKNNALRIVNWYMNNLEELGNLGSPEVKVAATDPAKSVTFDVLTSIDVTPSDEQQKAIDNHLDANLTVSSSEIEDGALYLIVHESDLRMGTFDVLLTRAYGNEIDINVPDLSPVTLTKITIDDVNSISSASTEISTEDTPQEIQDNDKENSGFRIVMYILLFVAVGGAGVLFVLAKRRNGSFKRK